MESIEMPDISVGDRIEFTVTHSKNKYSGEVYEIDSEAAHGSQTDVFLKNDATGEKFALVYRPNSSDVPVRADLGTVMENGEYEWEGLGEVESVTVDS